MVLIPKPRIGNTVGRVRNAPLADEIPSLIGFVDCILLFLFYLDTLSYDRIVFDLKHTTANTASNGENGKRDNARFPGKG